MKKSQMFLMAQVSVVNDAELSATEKIEILHELFEKEDLAKFVEEREEEEAAQNGEL